MPKRREIERREHEQWLSLCEELKRRGVVTEADLKSSVNLLNTPGQWLLNMIRVWGNLRAQLGVRDYDGSESNEASTLPVVDARALAELVLNVEEYATRGERMPVATGSNMAALARKILGK